MHVNKITLSVSMHHGSNQEYIKRVSKCSSCSVPQVTVGVCHTTSLSDHILSECVGVVVNYLKMISAYTHMVCCGLYLQPTFNFG